MLWFYLGPVYFLILLKLIPAYGTVLDGLLLGESTQESVNQIWQYSNASGHQQTESHLYAPYDWNAWVIVNSMYQL